MKTGEPNHSVDKVKYSKKNRGVTKARMDLIMRVVELNGPILMVDVAKILKLPRQRIDMAVRRLIDGGRLLFRYVYRGGQRFKVIYLEGQTAAIKVIL